MTARSLNASTDEQQAELLLQVKRLPHLPGVYRYFDAQGHALYVGKARDLNRRVGSYFSQRQLSPRISLMVSKIALLETSVTGSEADALILENNLIKTLKPRYNILFRDDKSYPYLKISGHEFARISYYRGSQEPGHTYFGPYPNGDAIREALQLLQKIFQLRTCTDSTFAHRSRPCLLHQIKRCSAPCVQAISHADYQQQVKQAHQFLLGDSKRVLQALQTKMAMHAKAWEFELAGHLRDQIQALSHVTSQQSAESDRTTVQLRDVDIVLAAFQGEYAVVNVAMVRNGRHLGDRAFHSLRVIPLWEDSALAPESTASNSVTSDAAVSFSHTETAHAAEPAASELTVSAQAPTTIEQTPRLAEHNLSEESSVLEIAAADPHYSAFLGIVQPFLLQHYQHQPIPHTLVLAYTPESTVVEWLQRVANHPLTLLGLNQSSSRSLKTLLKGQLGQWVQLNQEAAVRALNSHLQKQQAQTTRMLTALETFGWQLPAGDTPFKVECFDASHTQGEATQVACVVYQGLGFANQLYRRYNIAQSDDFHGGDDYGALRNALTRHFTRHIDSGLSQFPDVVLIDGGKGQVNVAAQVFQALELPLAVIVGIAKGEGRKVGLEVFHFADGRAPLELAADHPALLWLAHIRDEAHRFAITGMRAQRARTRQQSRLETLEGVGSKRRQKLLLRFGSLRGIADASVEDIAKVEGISAALAKRIYDFLH